MTNTKEKVQTITAMLNVYGFPYTNFCEYMAREHRTLQQSFTRLCVEWLKTCASENYLYDGRNIASHELAKRIMDTGIDLSLPFI